MSDMLTFSGQLEIQAAAGGEKKPTAIILAYSGGAMTVPNFGSVVIDLAELDISAAVPLLIDHDSSLQGVVGSGVARIEGSQLIVSGTLATTNEAGEKVIELGKGGFPWQASVGVQTLERKRIAAGQTITVNNKQITAGAGGLTLVQRGSLREVSICAVGSDPSTSVAIAASLAKGKRQMTDTNNAATELLPENAEGLTDQERIQARWGRESWHDPNGGPRRRAQQAMISASAGRIEFSDFESQLLRDKLADSELALLRATAPKGPSVHAGTQGGSPHAVIEGMLLAHLGAESLGEKTLGAATMQMARDHRAGSMLEIMKASFALDGREIPSDQNQMIRAGFSTVSLPTALGNTANKIAMEAYQQAVPTWRSFCAIKSASNFKQHTGVRLTDRFNLKELPPAGTIKHGSLSESTYAYQIDTYAKMLRLTRQDIINDDLGLFNDTAQAFGRGSQRKLSDIVYTVALANAGSFFHAADNSNYQEGAGTALQASALTSALLLMRGQTDADGAVLDIAPKTLLVPPELEETAKALLQSDFIQLTSTTAAGAPTGNVHKNALALEVESRLSNSTFTGYSALAWYLFASPADAPLIAAFLNGQESPTIEFFGLDSEPSNLGVTWRVYIDFGAALADPKAAVKSKGEA